MSRYLAHATPQNIGYLLIIAVVLWFAYKISTSPRNLHTTKPKRYPVNPSNAASLLAAMPSLRTDLPQHKNQTVPAENLDEVLAHTGVSEQDRADIIKGSKL